MEINIDKLREEVALKIGEAVKNNIKVVFMMENEEEGDFSIFTNNIGAKFNDLKDAFLEMPFLGRTLPEQRFEEWTDYYEQPEKEDIWSFGLEDGHVQVSVLDGVLAETKLEEEN